MECKKCGNEIQGALNPDSDTPFTGLMCLCDNPEPVSHETMSRDAKKMSDDPEGPSSDSN